MSALVHVHKLDLHGQETWGYSGQVLERTPEYVRLEAYFDREDSDFHAMRLLKGDRFVETFYTRRWYNIFEIYDRDSGQLKGWYCNIGHPADVQDGHVSYRDLALDLLVYPDGRSLVLDEDEFAALPLTSDQRRACLAALAELQAHFARLFAPAA